MSYMEMAWNQGYAVMLSLYCNVVFTIVVVLAINAIVGRIRPFLALHSREILILFAGPHADSLGMVGLGMVVTFAL